MAIITTSQNITSVTYARGEILDIRNGATLTISATPATRPGTIQCLTSGKLRIENSSTTVPLLLDLDDMNNDLRFEAAGVFEVRGAPMSLGVGTGAAITWDFTTLFGGVIKTMTYCEVEETAGSGVYMPWAIVDEDPKYNLNVGLNVSIGGATDSAFTAGNTPAGRVLFWHETNRTLRCGDNTNGMAVPTGCAVRIPNIYISNRHDGNASRGMQIITQGTPTGGTFTLEIKNEAGTVLGTTGNIAFNATAAAIDTAIEAVTGAGTVTSSGGALPTAVGITWAGSLTTGFGNFPSVRVASSALTGGTNATVHCYEGNMLLASLIDISPLGTLDCEWVSFSHKIRCVNDNFTAVRLVNVGMGADLTQFNNSNGSIYIDGFSRTQGPFTGIGGTTQISNLYGDTRIKRFVGFSKGPNYGLNLSVIPRLLECDRVYGGFYGKRSGVNNAALGFVTLPTGVKITNATAIGAAFVISGLTDARIVAPAYADGTLNAQDATSPVVSCFAMTNCINPVIAGFKAAGPMQYRGQTVNPNAACANVQFFGGGVDMGNNGDRPVYLACAGSTFQNMAFPNIRSGPFIDTVSTWLANGSSVKKLFGTFATAQIATGLDASTGGQYDLVTSTIAGITETFAGVGDFVGGNYTDPSLTPTTGHVTFGPFGAGVGLELTGGGYTDALGAFLLPTSGDTATVTMPFAMHGITSFQDAMPRLYVDAPGAAANSAVIGAPGAPTGGTFTVTVADSSGTVLGTTSALAYNAGAPTMDAAIEAIAGIGTGVAVSGSLSAGYSITFPSGQVRIVSVNGSALTGGTEPGVAYAVGRARLLDGTETIGAAHTCEFAVRVPGTSWPAYQALNGTNLSGCIAALTGYAAGGSGIEMRVKFTTAQTNPFTKFSQVSLLTNVNPNLWTVGDATIDFQGPNPTDVIRIVRAADLTVLYSFTGSGVKEFTIGDNFDVPVFFRREQADGTVLMRTLPATQKLSFGSNGGVPLFYGMEVQLAQASEVTAMKATIDAYLDAAISTRLASSAYTAPANSDIAAIKAKTDSLTFTQSGVVDANIQYVNDVQIQGTGVTGDSMRPA